MQLEFAMGQVPAVLTTGPPPCPSLPKLQPPRILPSRIWRSSGQAVQPSWILSSSQNILHNTEADEGVKVHREDLVQQVGYGFRSLFPKRAHVTLDKLPTMPMTSTQLWEQSNALHLHQQVLWRRRHQRSLPIQTGQCDLPGSKFISNQSILLLVSKREAILNFCIRALLGASSREYFAQNYTHITKQSCMKALTLLTALTVSPSLLWDTWSL